MVSLDGAATEKSDPPKREADFETLKYQLLGPSLTKAGQDAVDQQKVRFAYSTVANDRTRWLTSGLGIRNYLQCFKGVKIF